MDSNSIRKAFIDFFITKQHEYVAPSSIAQTDDPSLLFTNAGMNQFKPIFLGKESMLSRAVNSQPCIRVSGKHNDLEDVGYDATHLTSFEMLGNWSFGDYYKKETIQWAWEFIVDQLKFDPNRLYVTVYKDDDEAFDIWKHHTSIDSTHIQRHGDVDNFWEMGETGPCGPCSEIHYDLGESLFPNLAHENNGLGVNTDSGRYVELWNLVFIQYNRLKNGELKELPRKHIDTGAGLERIASIMNHSFSNYETDGLRPLIDAVEELSSQSYAQHEAGVPHRVIADHIRTICWTIAEHVVPTNDGRGYVMRRLLRRALRYGQTLQLNEPFLHKLVDVFADMMKDAYPHVYDQRSFIRSVVLAEEHAFLKTLSKGLVYLQSILAANQQNDTTILSGADGFRLYDTYGFPIDLTALIAREQHMDFDLDGCQELLEAQRIRSRKASAFEDASVDKQNGAGPVIDPSLHAGVYTDTPGGGECKIAATEKESVLMARHHTATHLLHACLEQHLGEHVSQSGSFVGLDYLRFDFTHFGKVSEDIIATIERDINQWIQQNVSIDVFETSLQNAKQQGIKALFGEKYGDTVRVVSIGDVSKELCGGTHVCSTGDIQAFRIVSESAVATGIRRIEAIAGGALVQKFDDDHLETLVQLCQSKFKALNSQYGELVNQHFNWTMDAFKEMNDSQLVATVDELVNASKMLQKQQSQQHDNEAHDWVNRLSASITQLENQSISYLMTAVDSLPQPLMKVVIDRLVDQIPSLIAVLVSQTDGRSYVSVKLGKDVPSAFHAHLIVKELLAHTGGKGGGKVSMAQGGNLDISKCDVGFAALKRFLSQVKS